MTDAELTAFYQAEYRRLYQQQEGPDPKDLAIQTARANALTQFVKDRVPEIKSHLDIGCSAGLLLSKFPEIYNCRSVGVEPGDAYRDYALSKGLTVYGSLEELQAKTIETEYQQFDLISMAHVLEHLPDPVGYLKALRDNFLSSAGWLLVEVPNLYCHDCFEVAHLVSYSSHTLTQTLHKAGFSTPYLQKHGEPRSAILPLYITVLAHPAPSQSEFKVKAEHNVYWKRKLGLLQRRIKKRLWPKQAWLPLQRETD
jgi:SAM-dependent methyltransferase